MILFPSHYLSSKQVDPDYQEEYDAARETGSWEIHILDQQAADNGDFSLAIKAVTHNTDKHLAVYRGWMLSTASYAGLYAALETKGVSLINNPSQYKNCHEFPGSFAAIEPLSPPAIHIPLKSARDFDNEYLEGVLEALAQFDGTPAILKDYVKSMKEYWEEACYIPDTSSRDDVERIIRRFLELRSELLTGGLVFKQYLDLKMNHNIKHEIPTNYRLFYFNNMLLLSYPAEVYEPMFERIPIEQINDVADKIPSSFFSLDVAEDSKGRWWIIEVGDGQVSGLPEGSVTETFYKGLAHHCIRD